MIGQLNDRQREIIIGTVLGGSSLIKPPLGKNYYLSMRDKNPTWILYKMQELTCCFKNGRLVQDGKTFRCSSVCSEVFTDIHDQLYYEGKRRLTDAIIEPMHDIGLAIWFLDSGGRTGRDKKNIYLNVTKFGTDGADVAMSYFQSLGWDCTLSKNKERMRLIFSVNGTEKVLKVIAPQFPPFLLSSDDQEDQNNDLQ